VLIGAGPADGVGGFALDLPGGLALSGRWTGEHQATALQGRLRGQPLELPEAAPLFIAPGLPGVAGGPADPEAWDRWFGADAPAAGGEAEQLARRRKAEALPARLGALYQEVARMRESGRIVPDRLLQIRAELTQFPDDWLLNCELGELLGPAAT